MAVPRQFAGPLLATLFLTGCGTTAPQPVTREGIEKPAAPPPSKAQEPEPASTPAAPSKEATPPSSAATSVVVDPGVEGPPPTLMEAARAERERRASAGKPIAVITDKTLPGYAKKGQVTVADPKKKGMVAAPPSTEANQVRDEAYWRGRGLDIRERWRDAVNDVKDLEQKATVLRQKFYLEGDTFTRDNQIKPEWDRVLERLRQAKLDVEATKAELAEFLDEGRIADVLPGWLREGEEIEPEELPRKREPGAPAQSIEPPVVEPPPANDPPLLSTPGDFS